MFLLSSFLCFLGREGGGVVCWGLTVFFFLSFFCVLFVLGFAIVFTYNQFSVANVFFVFFSLFIFVCSF